MNGYLQPPVRGTRSLLENQITLLTEEIEGNDSALASLDLRVDDLESEVVLKAEVTSGGITKLAAVELDASISGGANLHLIADDVNITTGGNELLIDATGINFPSVGSTFSDIQTIQWGSNTHVGAANLGTGDILGLQGADHVTINAASGNVSIDAQGDIMIDATTGPITLESGSGIDLNGTSVQINGSDVATESWVSSNFLQSVGAGTGLTGTGSTLSIAPDEFTVGTPEYLFGVSIGENLRKITPNSLSSLLDFMEIASNINLGHLNGVSTPSPSTGDVLRWDGQWEAFSGDTTNVSITDNNGSKHDFTFSGGMLMNYTIT